jgi:glycosyltransferase involved in cell wall biosynthesis
VEYITEPSFDGGLANYLHRVALSLLHSGHQPIIIVASDKDETFFHEGIEVHRVRIAPDGFLSVFNRMTMQRFLSASFWIAQSWQLNAEVRRIHRMNPVSIIQYASCAATGLFRLSNIPCVVRISGYLPLWNKAYGYDRTRDVALSERLEEIAYARADGLFAPSLINAKAVETASGKRVSIIESPCSLENEAIDETLFHNRLWGKRYLLFFGSIGLMKGVALIAEIMENLLRNNPQLYFVFAGKDLGYKAGNMIDYVESKAGVYRKRVIYLGRLPRQKLFPIIQNAYAVVLPSRIDNFPNTCLEAMAHRRVVIGTLGTSFEQLLKNGESGFLCQRDDPSDLMGVLEKVLNLSDQQRSEIGGKAFDRIWELRPEKSIKQLTDYYKEIISEFHLRN